jgi:hypothetical protein
VCQIMIQRVWIMSRWIKILGIKTEAQWTTNDSTLFHLKSKLWEHLNFSIRIRGNKSIEEWGPPHLFTMVRMAGQGLCGAQNSILHSLDWIWKEIWIGSTCAGSCFAIIYSLRQCWIGGSSFSALTEYVYLVKFFVWEGMQEKYRHYCRSC